MKKEILPQSTDYVVIGAGAAGLATALFAAIEGKSVIVLERSDFIGGTSAYTAGTLWVPGTSFARKAGIDVQRDLEDAAEYVKHVSRLDAKNVIKLKHYLQLGPEAINTLESNTRVSFDLRSNHPDYFSSLTGSSKGYRAIEAKTFINYSCKILKKIRPQQQELTVMGGMALDRIDIEKLSAIAKQPLSIDAIKNYFHAAGLLTNHIISKLIFRRNTRFTMGNALIARLVASLEDFGVPIITGVEIKTIDQYKTHSFLVDFNNSSGESSQLVSKNALVIASGGFNRNPELREKILGRKTSNLLSAISPGTSGNLYSQIIKMGAIFDSGEGQGAFWAPISLPPRNTKSYGVYPHFAMDRGKPGFIVVDRHGTRYQNEALSYNHFSQQMLLHGPSAQPSYLIGTKKAVKNYGIGVVRPGGWGKRRRLKDGYLVKGRNLHELANKLKIPYENLKKSIDRFNSFAEKGFDADFNRGGSDYEKNLGGFGFKNPNLGPLVGGPFYAIKLYPGEIGASAGFKTDEWSSALDRDDKPIPGLYIVGNDMSSVFGMNYPGPGVTLGPAVVFGYAAVKHSNQA